MQQFHLARWRPYKGLLALAALATPIIYYLARSPFDESWVSDRMFTRRVVQMSIAGLIGWFLILFGDGSLGRMPPNSMRSYYVMLGIGFLVLF